MQTPEPATEPTPDPSTGSSPAAPRTTSRVGVTVLCLLAGLLFGTSASLARADPTGSPTDLPELITARDRQVRDLTTQTEVLGKQGEALRDERASSRTGQVIRTAESMAPAVGLAAVSGPAIAVSLDDAGYTLDTLPEGFSVDDVVVHQQDLQGVINALWAGGAEAIMVQDQRIIATSSVQCVGNTLYLEGRVYSPPYTVTAVGDPDALHAALEADPVVQTYRDWSAAVGLGYAVQDLGETELPAFVGSVRPQHATIVSGQS